MAVRCPGLKERTRKGAAFGVSGGNALHSPQYVDVSQFMLLISLQICSEAGSFVPFQVIDPTHSPLKAVHLPPRLRDL